MPGEGRTDPSTTGDDATLHGATTGGGRGPIGGHTAGGGCWHPALHPQGANPQASPGAACSPRPASPPRPLAAAPARPGLLQEDAGPEGQTSVRPSVPAPPSFLAFVGCLCRTPVPAGTVALGTPATSSSWRSRFLRHFPPG